MNGGLFRSVMGEEFDKLDPAVARFHGTGPGARAVGSLRVRRGESLLSKCCGWFMRVPSASESTDVRLDVSDFSGGEHWSRRFGDRPFESRMWEQHGLLVEGFGPARFWFNLRAEAGSLIFDTVSCRILGIPLPRVFWPRIGVQASPGNSEQNSGDVFGIHVELSLPIVGLIAEYSGDMRQLSSAGMENQLMGVDP